VFEPSAGPPVAAFGICGQRSALEFNLNELMNRLAERRRLVRDPVISCGLLKAKHLEGLDSPP
jgi:hypothetical protein